MNCPVCGNEMPEGVTQCSACGYSADAAQPVQQMQPAMPVTLQNVVDMMGQMLQELAAIREAMKRE